MPHRREKNNDLKGLSIATLVLVVAAFLISSYAMWYWMGRDMRVPRSTDASVSSLNVIAPILMLGALITSAIMVEKTHKDDKF